MRSSSNFLAVSRSELGVDPPEDDHESDHSTGYLPHGRETDDHTGLDIHITVSYKTLLLVFALFSAAQRLFNVVVDHFV